MAQYKRELLIRNNMQQHGKVTDRTIPQTGNQGRQNILPNYGNKRGSVLIAPYMKLWGPP